MINESNIVRLNFFKSRLCSLVWYDIKDFLFTFSKLQTVCSYLIYLLSYLMLNMVAPYHTKIIKMSKVNSLDLELAIDPPPPKGNCAHYDFLIQHYISHKMKYVSPLRVAALACNITLRTVPAKYY